MTLRSLACLLLVATPAHAADPYVLLDRARTFEHNYQAYHSPNGLMHEVTFAGEQVSVLHGTSDCAIWTGIYVAAAAARFALYRDDSSRAALRRAIEGVHLLHAVTGKPGLYARCAWKDTDAVAYDPAHPEIHQGTGDYTDYWWRGDVSQDQISGVVFGLAFAYDITDEPDLRALIAADLGALARHLMQNLMMVIDVDDQVTEHGNLNPTGIELFGFSMDGFMAVMGLGIIQAAAHVTGDPDIAAYYRDTLLDTRDYDDMVRGGLMVEVPDSVALLYANAECDTNYNNFNMMFLSMFNLLRLEEDAELRALYQTALTERLWADPGAPPVIADVQLPGEPNHREVRDQANSFWTYIYYGLTGSPDSTVLAQAEQSLAGYWAPPVTGPFYVDNSATHPEQCLNRFEEPMHKDGVIPMTGRAPNNFVWKANPYNVIQDAAPVTFSAVDYLVAYWLGRYFGFLSFPDRDQDGLADDREEALGTDPDLPDSDGDGVSDGDEVDVHGTDPLVAPDDGGHDGSPAGDATADGSPGDHGPPASADGPSGDPDPSGEPPAAGASSGCACSVAPAPWPLLLLVIVGRRRRL